MVLAFKKENLLYSYTFSLFIHLSMYMLVYCKKLDEPGEHYTKWNKPYKGQILYDITYIQGIKK